MAIDWSNMAKNMRYKRNLKLSQPVPGQRVSSLRYTPFLSRELVTYANRRSLSSAYKVGYKGLGVDIGSRDAKHMAKTQAVTISDRCRQASIKVTRYRSSKRNMALSPDVMACCSNVPRSLIRVPRRSDQLNIQSELACQM